MSKILTANELVANIKKAAANNNVKPTQSEELRLGTVAGTYVASTFPDIAVTVPVTFDGEDITANYISTIQVYPNDRVLLMKKANAWVITNSLTPNSIGVKQVARKIVDTSRANTATAVADPHLVLPMLANASYDVEFVGLADGLAAADIRVTWSPPAGSAGSKMISGPALSLTSRDGNLMRVGGYPYNTDIGYGTDNTLGQISFHERGLIITGATAGNFTINWAQVSANATASTLSYGSFISVTRVT